MFLAKRGEIVRNELRSSTYFYISFSTSPKVLTTYERQEATSSQISNLVEELKESTRMKILRLDRVAG